MKKLFALLFVMALLSVGVLAVPTAVEVVDNGGERLSEEIPLFSESENVKSGTCGTNLTWTLDDEGTLTISGTGAMTNWSWFSDKPWYDYADSIIKVIIGDGITSIGEEAFSGCGNIVYVRIPETVVSIGREAFSNCSSLKSIRIPEKITTIEYRTFGGCHSLTEITIPDSVTTIGMYAFMYCTDLKEVTVPESVTSIGDSAFADCTNLVKIILPSNLSEIDNYMFKNCINLASIAIPDKVTAIGNYAFSNCTGLTSITIPDRVAKIGQSVFFQCTNLEMIMVNESNKMFSNDENGVLFNKNKTTLLQYPIARSASSYTIPNGVTIIERAAFYDCKNLDSVSIPDSTARICEYAFWGCNKLIEITIPKSVTNIGNSAFYNTGVTIVCHEGSFAESYAKNNNFNYYYMGQDIKELGGACGETLTWSLINGVLTISGSGKMTDWSSDSDLPWYDVRSSLKSVVIKDGVTNIGNCAFQNCTTINKVTIPESVVSIGEFAFYNCGGIESVYVSGIVAWCNMSFNGASGSPLSNGADLYSDNKKVELLVIPDSVTTISEYAFYNCSSLVEVTFSDSVTSISRCAFSECENLESVKIGKNVDFIGESAFEACENLKEVSLFDGIKRIEGHAFSNCYNLNAINFPDSVTEIGYSAFRGCSALTDITLSKNLKVLQPFVFADCTSLKTIDIPEGVICIGDGAFSGCYNLERVIIPDSMKYIVGRTVSWCEKLNELNLPDSIQVVDSFAFVNTGYYNNESNWNNGSLYYENILLAIDKDYNNDYVVDEKVEYIALNTFDYFLNNQQYKAEPCKIIIKNSDKYSDDVDEYLFSKDKKTIYECFNYWSSNEIIVPDGVKTIGAFSFQDLYTSSITLPKGVVTIEDGAFYGCSDMESIIIPNGVKSIGMDAFNRCYSLGSVTIPASVTYIGDDAFFWCGSWAEDGFTIYGYDDTRAESYAYENNINFVSLGEIPYTPGELNSDGAVDMNDAILLLQHSMFPELYPLDYAGDVDFTGDGVVDMNDAILLLQHSMFPELYPIN